MTRVSGDWVTFEPTQTVFSMLEDAGHQAFFVGGCVRNALLGEPVGDLDIATNARPQQVLDRASQVGLKAIPTGIDHGTVTVVSQGLPHEITTFRADVETDGRHAIVNFCDHMEDDALRRDFTMNALYADRRGMVVDPLGGVADLTARRVRFIQDADKRIREDFLRILRFFRFNAWYGDPALGWDADALAAISENIAGLSSLSRERVGGEITKLLLAPDPAPAVSAMAQTGALAACLPGASPVSLPVLVHLEQMEGVAPDALRRLAGIGVFDGKSLRFSKKMLTRLIRIQDALGAMMTPAELGYRHGFDLARDTLLIRGALAGTPVAAKDLTWARQGSTAKFPIAARDLMPALSGPALGDKLKELETRWIASRFTETRDDLLR
ncbi:MAG: CCA tRNA nucleotidyltransferase [Oceanicola sp.]|nr:CCA tRNA nucleotidyltransferase [Oceanicola sp.]